MQLTCELHRVPTDLLRCRLANFSLQEALQKALRPDAPPPMAEEELELPGSIYVHRALALVREVSPPFLLNHCVRTYFFAQALGKRARLRFDLEVVCLGSLMHDLGLTSRFRGEDSFELAGARAAYGHLTGENYPLDRAALVHEAIALHAAVGIASEREPEVALVHLGAGTDIVGARVSEIAPATIRAIVAEWPRLGFKEHFTELLQAEALRLPESHIAGHVDLGLNRKIQAAGLFTE